MNLRSANRTIVRAVSTAAAASAIALAGAGCSAKFNSPVNSHAKGLQYSSASMVFTKGLLAIVNPPSVIGNDLAESVTFSVTPNLPDGLTLDPTSGAIGGIPTTVTPEATYTISASIAGLSSSETVQITVDDQAPYNLIYSLNPAIYTVNLPIAPNKPINAGGLITSFDVAPSLPAGLTLDPVTGILSGTPTAITPQANYVVTASNSGGTTTATLQLTVNDGAPNALSYQVMSGVYTKGSAITPNDPIISGGTITSWQIAPDIYTNTGLVFDSSTGIISGTPTAIVGSTVYTITATNAGGSTSCAILVTINDVPPSSLAYTFNPVTYTNGVTITNNTPSNAGGTITSYSASQPLPAGLSLDPNTGVISGKPTAITSTATYTIIGSNSGGNTAVNVQITVNDAAPSGLSYATNPATYTKGVAIAANNPSNSGGAITSYSASGLPPGLSINPNTGVITGTPAGPLQTATNYTITGTNSGGSTSVTVSLTVVDVPPSGLSYSANPATYVKGTAITANSPALTGGGPVTSWSIAPNLFTNTGLTFDTSSGVITGNPSLVSGSTTYVVTATNSGGSTTVNLVIQVNDIPPTSLSYSAQSPTFTKGIAITNDTPSNSGGTITSYSISPNLNTNTGLTFNPSTGVISGTPSILAAAANYTVTGTNSGGNTTDVLSITVIDQAPTGLTYSSNPATYTIGTAITPNSPSNSGGTVVSYALDGSSPPLPAGLSLNTTTGVISGTGTAVVATNTYTIDATNTGGTATVGVQITVNDVPPSSLIYTPASPSAYTAGTTITAITPTHNGGAITSCTSSPPLPAGLTLSQSDCTLQGTPTALENNVTHTITATNSGGSTTGSVTITVNNAPPTNLTYPTVVLTKNVAITSGSIVPSNGGGPITSYTLIAVSSGPLAWPNGLSLNSSTGEISGTPAVLQTTAINYTIQGSNSQGSTTYVLPITINDQKPVISYSAPSPTYTSGVTITSNTPSNAGGAVTSSWAISPDITTNTGLSFDTTTGVISGTPTALETTATTYTVTVSNSGGSATATVVVTVNDVAPSALSYTSNPMTFYNARSTYTDTVASVSGGPVVTYGVSPPLPNGLAIDPSTGTISGTPTADTAASNYTVTATNSGGSTTATVNIQVTDFPAQLTVYASDNATVMPATLNYGTTNVEVYYGWVYVHNTGGLATSAITVSIGGANASMFSDTDYTADQCQGATVPAGSYCILFIDFLANKGGTSAGTYNGTLSISAASGGTVVTNLTGSTQYSWTPDGGTSNPIYTIQSYPADTSTTPSTTAGSCSQQGLTETYAPAGQSNTNGASNGGTTQQMTYNSSGNSVCTAPNSYYYQQAGTAGFCAGSPAGTYNISGNGHVCEPNNTNSTIWTGYLSQARPLNESVTTQASTFTNGTSSNQTCDSNYPYIVLNYSCK